MMGFLDSAYDFIMQWLPIIRDMIIALLPDSE